MPDAPAPSRKPKAGALAAPKQTKQPSAQPAHVDENAIVRLHITPFTPDLLKVYIAPSVLPFAKNISYHAVETFPEKGFGYVELPAMEAQKLKKKLNGSTLRGSKVRIEDAKPEKRKAADDAEALKENGDRPAKRSKKEKPKKEKPKKEQGVLEGVELPADRKVKRGWTEPPAKNKKERKGKKDKKTKQQKESKYTKEPEILFKAMLTPVAATELSTKKKRNDKNDKKKAQKKSIEVVHEFGNNTKQPSFLKATQVSTEKKAAVEYVDGKGWVDEDGNVVEPETSKARNRRALELVNGPLNADVPKSSASPQPTIERKVSATPDAQPSKSESKSKLAKNVKAKKVTPPPSSSSSEAEESSVVSSSEDDSSDSDAESSVSSPAVAPDAPSLVFTPSSPALEKKEVHPLEVLFKRPKPPAISALGSASTPTKLAPIKTSFSFFDGDSMDADEASGNPPMTPFTKQDLEWRGLRSAAPTPDTAAIGRRFSFSWRTGSQEADDDDDDDHDDVEAGKQLSDNTKANVSASRPDTIAEESENAESSDEDDNDYVDANQTPIGTRKSTRNPTNSEGEREQSEFAKFFWENRGEHNRAWKKRRREALKAKRLKENRKITGGRRLG